MIVVGAGLPHLPAVLSAAKSYSERLFRYQRIDRLDRIAADQALCAPALREGVEYEAKALDALSTALELDPDLRSLIAEEQDFDHLRGNPEFDRLALGSAPRT